jgi:SAM-dependent methyltransferase
LAVSRAAEMAYHARRELRVRKEKMERTQDKIVVSTFGPRAKAYVDSAVHAKGVDLDTLEALIGAAKPTRAIDIGCGGGHVSYLMARHAGGVVAADLSSEMLAAVAATAKERGLANIETARASAEKLPFPDGSFDFAATRYSAHHWHDFQGGLREARRVLKAGSRAAFIDAYSAGSALVDTHLQAVELTRDPSHVRDYSIAEWTAALALAGFRIDDLRTAPHRAGAGRLLHARRDDDPGDGGVAPLSGSRAARRGRGSRRGNRNRHRGRPGGRGRHRASRSRREASASAAASRRVCGRTPPHRHAAPACGRARLA